VDDPVVQDDAHVRRVWDLTVDLAQAGDELGAGVALADVVTAPVATSSAVNKSKMLLRSWSWMAHAGVVACAGSVGAVRAMLGSAYSLVCQYHSTICFRTALLQNRRDLERAANLRRHRCL
jgi:hypothetical protein